MTDTARTVGTWIAGILAVIVIGLLAILFAGCQTTPTVTIPYPPVIYPASK